MWRQGCVRGRRDEGALGLERDAAVCGVLVWLRDDGDPPGFESGYHDSKAVHAAGVGAALRAMAYASGSECVGWGDARRLTHVEGGHHDQRDPRDQCDRDDEAEFGPSGEWRGECLSARLHAC